MDPPNIHYQALYPPHPHHYYNMPVSSSDKTCLPNQISFNILSHPSAYVDLITILTTHQRSGIPHIRYKTHISDYQNHHGTGDCFFQNFNLVILMDFGTFGEKLPINSNIGNLSRFWLSLFFHRRVQLHLLRIRSACKFTIYNYCEPN